MKFKHIHFIINPASGKEEPVLSYINQVMIDHRISWDISVTKKNLDADQIARKLIGKTDLLAVYGGDGCVTKVAAALHGTNQLMAIIPGGTANVMAKELGIPLDTREALSLLVKGRHKMMAVDMGMVNKTPFLLRVNLGVMADMVTEADREMKNHLGQLAYGVSAIKTVAKATPTTYQIKIDGQQITASAVALTITNSGSIGIGDFALQPGISITDGLLDVVLMKDNTFSTLMKAAGSTLLQQETDALQHWTAKKVVISMDKKQTFICDDTAHQAMRLNIRIIPGSIRILVPLKVN